MTRGMRVAACLLAVLILLAIAGPMFAPDHDVQSDLVHGILLRPSSMHLLGTDALSRDIFARLAWGARISLCIAGIAIAVAALIGTGIGLIAASGPAIVQAITERVINLGLAMPRLIVLMIVLAGIGRLPVVWLGIVLGLTGWPAVARLVRGEALRLRVAAFVTAARALGASSLRIVLREILPGTLPALFVASALGVADVILLEAGLSFIGIGVQQPTPSWGGMIFEAREHLNTAPWLLIAPCVALVIATSAATLFGDAMQRSLQPETR